MAQQFLYHFRPYGLTGTILYPLNVLKSMNPEAYAYHVKKYEGREWLLNERVQILDCLWNDVLHLSPLHPQKVIDCFREIDLYDDVMQGREDFYVFKIPASEIDWERTVAFQSFNFVYGKRDRTLDKFWKLSLLTYKEQETVHPSQIRVWKADHAAGRRPLWFSHTMHILTQTPIDTRNAELVLCR